jgi:hypothetical protein
LEKISKLKNTWNCGTQPNEYKEERTIAMEQGTENFCRTWIESEPPVLDNVNRDPFLDTPLDIEVNSATDSVKVESSPSLDGINYKLIKYLPEETRKLLLAGIARSVLATVYRLDNRGSASLIKHRDNFIFFTTSLIQ